MEIFSLTESRVAMGCSLLGENGSCCRVHGSTDNCLYGDARQGCCRLPYLLNNEDLPYQLTAQVPSARRKSSETQKCLRDAARISWNQCIGCKNITSQSDFWHSLDYPGTSTP